MKLVTDIYIDGQREKIDGAYIFYFKNFAVLNPKLFRFVTTDLFFLSVMEEKKYDFIGCIDGALYFKKKGII